MNCRKRKTSSATVALSLGVLMLNPSFCLAWGTDGHVYVNEVAAKRIPKAMPSFLRTKAAIERITYLGPEPDRWRAGTEYALKNAQEPDHFIDLERVADLGELPQGRYEFYKLLYEKRDKAKVNADDYLPEKVGLQPYIVIEIFDRLKVAFREYRKLREANQSTVAIEHNIVFYAGWLGHYVADGSQPLHTTINYDGWVERNPSGYVSERGIHRRFETDFVAANIGESDFSGLVGLPRELEHPFEDYLLYLKGSNSLVERVYQLDKAAAFSGVGTPESLIFVQRRLAAGCQMLLDLWYTAWIESAE